MATAGFWSMILPEKSATFRDHALGEFGGAEAQGLPYS
jgi:hypothetical protein